MLLNKEKNFISAVIYVYNLEKSIYGMLEKIACQLQSRFESFEIICVNDFSTDSSCQEIQRFLEDNPGNTITILNMSFYQGLELAMNAGVDLAIGDFIYEFDTDLDFCPAELIISAYERAIQGYDLSLIHIFRILSGESKREKFPISARIIAPMR